MGVWARRKRRLRAALRFLGCALATLYRYRVASLLEREPAKRRRQARRRRRGKRRSGEELEERRLSGASDVENARLPCRKTAVEGDGGYRQLVCIMASYRQ